MAHKYIVDLTPDEQEHLLNLIKKAKLSARKVARALVLLHADEGATDGEIAESLHLGVSTVRRSLKRTAATGQSANSDWQTTSVSHRTGL
jgi:DNA-directed RNA polymerase specialized sigma24 family protein